MTSRKRCHPEPAPAGEGPASSRSSLVTRHSQLLSSPRTPYLRALRVKLFCPCVFCLCVFSLLLLSPAQAQQTDRAKSVGHRMFCMCGCKQILVECNHVGCTMSTKMLHQLDAELASGKSDDLVLQSFVQSFGAEVIAEPPAKGFNWLAWIMPFAMIGAGLFVVRSVIARWSHPAAAPAGAAPSSASASAAAPASEVLARIRRDTEED